MKLLILAAIKLLAPADGAEVVLLPESQRAVLAKEVREERTAVIEGQKKAKTPQKWRASNPVKVIWSATAGEKGPWEVQLAKKPDFSDARLFDFGLVRDDRTAFTNTLEYANLEIATTYYWKVIAHEKGGDVASEVRRFTTEDLAPRWIQIEGRVGNFRDLGGRVGLGGKRVRQGMVYRSQGLNDNSSSGGRRKGRNRLFVEDVAYLTGTLGIRTDLDLRSGGETANMTTSPLGPNVKFVQHSSSAYKGIFSESGKKTMAENFRVFTDRANYPIIFHCIAGADRTGALGYVLNGVLGVSKKELETDWESTFYPNIPFKDKDGNLTWNSEQHFNDGFGKFGDANSTWCERIVLYLKSCGITDEEIETFRSIMLSASLFSGCATPQFTNPVGSDQSPDPFVCRDAGTDSYYLLFTRGKDLCIFRSRTLANIRDGESKVIYEPRDEDGIYGCIWAPEMHKAPNGKWYIYTSGAVCKNDPRSPKRLFILESKTADPFDGFVYRGKPAPDLFAIDPTVFTADDGRQSICYSEVKPGRGQVLVIREMENPWTFGRREAEIAHPELPWELVDQQINEGAFFVRSPDGRRLFIVYSANGCWCDDYALGVLEFTGGDLYDAKNWKKHPAPLLVKGNGAFGPGHASFFRSPDGRELWCAYHALRASNPKRATTTRWLNFQKVGFDAAGYPVMGVASGKGPHDVPSGE